MSNPTGGDLIEEIRQSIYGHDAIIRTGYGEKPLVYADYGASGRVSRLIDKRVEVLSWFYANPHNDDSATGLAATAALKQAYDEIKQAVNASSHHALIACANGATGAIAKLQEILGVGIPPATKAFLETQAGFDFKTGLSEKRPVVFIGPYEHHSNELSWRESLAQTVAIKLDDQGGIDLDHLARELASPRYKNRRKIGAFSAASNVTGVKTDIDKLARLLHRNGAILCLDCAASAPYLAIDLSPTDPQAAPDAVYFSPHKMIGGPGSCGLLVINKALYSRDLAPTMSGGGTVRYVTQCQHDFITDIEARERAGTPGLYQIQRAAECLKLLEQMGWDQIEQREHHHLSTFLQAIDKAPGIEVLGPQSNKARIGLVSFNIKDETGKILHPRLVSCLLNDLYGIQARAGCSCAGPYGHVLLGLDHQKSLQHRQAVLEGYAGLRPGWVRISLHWSMSETEMDYLTQAILQLADFGSKFIKDYSFDAHTGAWSRVDGVQTQMVSSGGGADLMERTLADNYALSCLKSDEPYCITIPEKYTSLAQFAGVTPV